MCIILNNINSIPRYSGWSRTWKQSPLLSYNDTPLSLKFIHLRRNPAFTAYIQYILEEAMQCNAMQHDSVIMDTRRHTKHSYTMYIDETMGIHNNNKNNVRTIEIKGWCDRISRCYISIYRSSCSCCRSRLLLFLFLNVTFNILRI